MSIVTESRNSYHFSFEYNGKKYEFSGNLKSCLGPVIDFLIENGYDFNGDSALQKPVSKEWIDSNPSYKEYLRNFYRLKNGLFFWIGGNVEPSFQRVKGLLVNFGVNPELINFSTSSTSIDRSSTIDKFVDFKKKENIEDGFKKNPFKQAICVLGSPSAGKSTTVRKVLRNENHKFDIWEPTAVTTNLLAQFDSQEGYVPSRLGELLIEAKENPGRCYTMVLDEFHKSNIIEMVNDELKHAISLKRYEGDRFISIDRPFRYLKQHLEVDDAGNVKVPDNFGFIFISSKPNVIANNRDIWDRLDIVNLTVENREGISTAEDLKKLVISEAEKLKMVSQRND